MSWETFLHDLRPEILIRLSLALLAGFVIGAERESHGRAAARINVSSTVSSGA